MAEGANWYVVHTYSGYENKVKANIEKTIANRRLQDKIFEVAVPVHDVVEIKVTENEDGSRRTERKNVSKKLFPGYVLINMIMDDNTWYVVRNTRGVTGFVGPGSKPVPLSEAEIEPLIAAPAETVVYFQVGDVVEVVNGPWLNTVGKVIAVNEGKQNVTIEVDMFGRETPVELGFLDIKKMY